MPQLIRDGKTNCLGFDAAGPDILEAVWSDDREDGMKWTTQGRFPYSLGVQAMTHTDSSTGRSLRFAVLPRAT